MVGAGMAAGPQWHRALLARMVPLFSTFFLLRQASESILTCREQVSCILVTRFFSPIHIPSPLIHLFRNSAAIAKVERKLWELRW